MGAIEDLVAGNFFTGVMTPFTTLMGTEVFYLMLWGSIIFIIFMRSKSIPTTATAILVTSFAIVPQIFAGTQHWFIVIIIASLVYMMYHVFKTG